MTATTDQLTAADVATMANVSVATIAKHRARGTIPPPDGQLGPVNWWYRSTIEAWLASRRRQGQRRAVPSNQPTEREQP
jgi:predicted DNA-binding transcriptional regulator AlpA